MMEICKRGFPEALRTTEMERFEICIQASLGKNVARVIPTYSLVLVQLRLEIGLLLLRIAIL